VHSGWLEDWRFLATADVMHSRDFGASFRGLRLPLDVIYELYRRNAQALFATGWNPAPSPGSAVAVATPAP
jgi:hypothetical protein